MTQDQIDCGADALRRYERGGKMLRLWRDLPNSTKKKWREKAEIVLSAAEREAARAAHAAVIAWRPTVPSRPAIFHPIHCPDPSLGTLMLGCRQGEPTYLECLDVVEENP